MTGKDAQTPVSTIVTDAHAQLGAQLRAALLNKDIRAMSVSGPWGTGKTHCVSATLKANWRDFASASLFGIKSISNLKLTLLDNVVAEQGGVRGWLARRTKADRDIYGAAIEKLYSGAAIANDLALIAFRSAIRGKVIVLDDLERKHADLDVDEVAGFIDELIQLSDCRVILVMNSERLTDHSKWMQIREKVIDRELFYSPTAQQSASIALAGHPLAAIVSPLIQDCGITNIRAIKRIALEVDWLNENKNPESKPLREFLAAFVLMMGANLHALGQQGTLAEITFDNAGCIKRDDPFSSACRMLLIDPESTFIETINLFLRSGVMPHDEIDSLLGDKIATKRVSELNFESLAVRSDHVWDIDWLDEDALEYSLQLLRESAGYCDPHLLSHTLRTLELIGGDATHPVAAQALADFSSSMQATNRTFPLEEYHPAVLKILQSLKRLVKDRPATKATEIDERMRGLASMGFAYASLLELDTSQASFVEQLESMDAADMRYVVPGLWDRSCKIIAGPDHPDLTAAAAFRNACSQYVSENPNSKRTRLIRAAMAGDRPSGQTKPARSDD